MLAVKPGMGMQTTLSNHFLGNNSLKVGALSITESLNPQIYVGSSHWEKINSYLLCLVPGMHSINVG